MDGFSKDELRKLREKALSDLKKFKEGGGANESATSSSSACGIGGANEEEATESNASSGEAVEIQKIVLDEEAFYAQDADPNAPILAYKRYSFVIEEIKRKKREGQLVKWKIKRQKQDLKMRKYYASKAYRFVWLWSLFLFSIITLKGFSKIEIKYLDFDFSSSFIIEDKVTIALITGVTVNIVAVFLVVMRNLFPNHKVNDKNKQKSEGEDEDDSPSEQKDKTATD